MSYAPRQLDHAVDVLRRRVLWLCVFPCLLLPGMLPATAVAEEETHLFNATLSITGDCSTSPAIDPVPDPGCPGGKHPPKPLTKHGGVAVDRYGNRYVASAGPLTNGSQGRIDVFGPTGAFLTEIPVVLPAFEVSLAVDSQGYLYVMKSQEFEPQTQRLLRFKPTKYNPAAGEVEYGDAPVVIPNPASGAFEPAGNWGNGRFPVAVDPTSDHLLVLYGATVLEFTSATEGNSLSQEIRLENIFDSEYVASFAVDAVRERVYSTALDAPAVFGGKPVVKAYDLKAPSDPEAPHELLFTIDGSTTPTERFVSETRTLPLAVDEATGHLFVADLEAPTRRVYEFDAAGEPVSTIEGPFKASGVSLLQLAYDDSPTSPTNGYLFVPSGNNPASSLAFEPKPTIVPPVVEDLSVSGVTTADAVLHGKVNPGGVEASYRVEFTTEAAFAAHGFEGATLAGEGTLNAASEGIAVSAAASGLSAGTAYRFRIVAESPQGEDEADSGFTTVASEEVSTSCSNQALRSGPSAALPDCRAYELVTPANTNGHSPFGTRFSVNTFTNRQVSPTGDRLPFLLEGAALSGLEGNGGFNGDPFLASRTASGWSTTYEGPSAVEAPAIVPGSGSPDRGYSFWQTDGARGSARIAPDTVYLRYPDGHSELVGQGSLGIDPNVQGRLITDGGSHVIFNSGGANLSAPAVQLEPEAAPGNTRAIYDRTADGTLHVVSLKPGDVPFGAGEEAEYGGASLDGVGIAFHVKGVLYLRYDDAETYEIGKGVKFAGVATAAGNRLFYVEGGDLWRFDVGGETRIRFSAVGDAVPVYVSADGSAAYFVSESAVAGSGPNPEGNSAQPGKQNLYRSEEGQVAFVATVTERDVEGEDKRNDGLGLWVPTSNEGSAKLGVVPARSTPDGGVLLFKSRAQLTGYDSGGHAEIYRYDAAASVLQCLSCNPTGAAATADADLQVQDGVKATRANQIFNSVAWLENLRADGRRAFFETAEALVATDTDQLNDVYEWEDQGVGSCSKPSGCLYLISYGQSGRDEFLWAVSKSGDDVFFFSQDLLAGGDNDETASIYDARVNGGFPAAAAPSGECLGEACQPSAVAPNDPTPASSAFQGAGNVKEKKTHSHKKKKHKKAKKKHKQAKGKRRAGR
jgi:hypothetical protein